MVKKQLKLKAKIPDTCFEFGGANSIHSVSGTKPKVKVATTPKVRFKK